MDNNVINLPTLISRVAVGAGVDMATSRRFIHDLFAIVERELEKGETVSIEGIGEFACGIGEGSPVLFRPDANLAAVINEPFSAFQPVEINAGAEKELDASVEGKPIEPVPVAKPVAEEEMVIETPVIAEEHKVAESSSEIMPETEQPSEISPELEPVVEPVKSEHHEDVKETKVSTYHKPDIAYTSEVANQYTPAENRSSSNTLWLVLGVMIGLIVGLIGGYFAGKTMGIYELPPEDEEYEEEAEEPSDNAPEIVESESDAAAQATLGEAATSSQPAPVAEPEKIEHEPVYDNVTTTLASLAKKHYGSSNYWVFIYQANPELKNPNQVSPGTKLLIPAYESFAGSTKEQTNAKAQEILNELSKKYRL